MIVKIDKLPKKAQHKRRQIESVLKCCEDHIYSIVKIDYNSGLIRFENLSINTLFLNFYSTSFTITVEHRAEGQTNKQIHFKKINHKLIKEILKDPLNFIYK
jgi:hypothetical protein